MECNNSYMYITVEKSTEEMYPRHHQLQNSLFGLDNISHLFQTVQLIILIICYFSLWTLTIICAYAIHNPVCFTCDYNYKNNT